MKNKFDIKQIHITEVSKSNIAEFWKLHWEYLNQDIFPNVTLGPGFDEEDREYFRSEDYRGIMEDYMEQSPDQAHMVYFYCDEVRIGCAEYVIYKSEDAKCMLMEFWVFPEYRGNGMGHVCFLSLRDYVFSDGAKYFEINVSNEKAHRFWTDLGFADAGADEWGQPLMKSM